MRERLIDALARQVNVRGASAPTVNSITAEAGLARSAFYNYFDDLEDLFRSYVDREVVRLAETLDERLSDLDDPVERIGIFVQAALGEFATHGAAFEAAAAHGLVPRLHGSEDLGPLALVLGTILGDGVASGQFASWVASPLVVPMVLRVIGTHQAGIAAGDVDVDEAVALVTSFVLTALRADLRTISGRYADG